MKEEGITSRTLKAYRESSGLAWKEIARRMEVTRETLQGFMLQDRWPTLRTLKKVARFFQWGPVEMGQAVMHVPIHLPKKLRPKRESPPSP